MFTILGADGKEYGPVTAGKMHEWIAGGRANLQTKARRDGETEWKTLGDFPEFSQFGAVSDAGPAPTPPLAPAPVSVPAPVFAAPAAALALAPASRWLRLGAVLLDSVIGLILALPGMALLLAGGIFTRSNQPNLALMLPGFLVLGIAELALLAVQIYLLSTRGQTIGKKLLGIRIVCFDDESNPGFVKAFLLRAFVNGLIGAVPFLGFFYSLVDICFIFRDDRRCIHDLIAGTKVVKA
jgi:uncharacterized RDD family membrane protein YckC